MYMNVLGHLTFPNVNVICTFQFVVLFNCKVEEGIHLSPI
jgi:hypothetical protein